VGIEGLPISCFDARELSCPLDSEWRKKVRPRKPVSTVVVGWHLYHLTEAGNRIHHEKCGCYSRKARRIIESEKATFSYG
jgi:hypothetical protein